MASHLGARGVGRRLSHQRVAEKAQAAGEFGAKPVLDSISLGATDSQRGRFVGFCLANTARAVAHSWTSRRDFSGRGKRIVKRDPLSDDGQPRVAPRAISTRAAPRSGRPSRAWWTSQTLPALR
jgi:hypothetical protein